MWKVRSRERRPRGGEVRESTRRGAQPRGHGFWKFLATGSGGEAPGPEVTDFKREARWQGLY